MGLLILYYGLKNYNIYFCSEANLGAAARIIVTIAASDEAHGIFQFSADSLTVNGTEPEEGRSTVVLQVSPSYKHGSSSVCFFCPIYEFIQKILKNTFILYVTNIELFRVRIIY